MNVLPCMIEVISGIFSMGLGEILQYLTIIPNKNMEQLFKTLDLVMNKEGINRKMNLGAVCEGD